MLREEIEDAMRLVKTDAYQMSVGEIVNMYKDGELSINPDFQRLFRWEIGQKSRLIESMLLGIPLPSIFVFEKEDATWELIDGLQRVSTILEFMGELKDPDSGDKKPPTALVSTKYLPSLNNTVWEASEEISDVDMENQSELSPSEKLSIKRSRLSVEILKRPSENATKYDLFQRLNSGGTEANAQELRNCIIIMVNRNYFEFLKGLSQEKSFLDVLSASSDQLEKQRHTEFATRFMVYCFEKYDGKLDVEEFIDEGIVKIASKNEQAYATHIFKKTFDILNQAYGRNALRRIVNGNHSGRVLLAAFETIAVGIALNMNNVLSKPDPVDFVKKRIERFWEQPNIDQFFTPGLRGTVRIQRTIPFGRDWFSK
jgi:uncharacterized protein DUF262